MTTVATELAGRHAVVTGGASGIGAACVRGLVAAGARVTIADRDVEAAQRVATELGTAVDVWPVDLADTEALAGEVVDGLDCDILVNNAGLQRVSPITELEPAVFTSIIAIMLTAPFVLIRAALPSMYTRGFGRVINISSVHGLRASAYKAAYVAAKHGLEGLSKVTALEGGEHGVTSNCISPAYVRTPLVEAQIADQARIHGLSEDEVVAKIMLTESTVKRLIEPEEVASLALWLVGDAAGMVTGASYTMDGGWTAR